VNVSTLFTISQWGKKRQLDESVTAKITEHLRGLCTKFRDAFQLCAVIVTEYIIPSITLSFFASSTLSTQGKRN
jgi:hypothetical protein